VRSTRFLLKKRKLARKGNFFQKMKRLGANFLPKKIKKQKNKKEKQKNCLLTEMGGCGKIGI
jgi:hypothetical protein